MRLVKKSGGVQNLYAENVQLGSFVVVRLVEYKPIAHISKKIFLRPISPRSPCAPDVPGPYDVNTSSRGVRAC